MSIGDWLAIGTLSLTLPLSLVAILQGRSLAKESIMKAGAHESETEQMKKNIERLFEKARIQEVGKAEIDKSIAETRNDIGWIRESVGEIKVLISGLKMDGR